MGYGHGWRSDNSISRCSQGSRPVPSSSGPPRRNLAPVRSTSQKKTERDDRACRRAKFRNWAGKGKAQDGGLEEQLPPGLGSAHTAAGERNTESPGCGSGCRGSWNDAGCGRVKGVQGRSRSGRDRFPFQGVADRPSGAYPRGRARVSARKQPRRHKVSHRRHQSARERRKR